MIFGHETWHWQFAKFPEVARGLSFYHRGSKLRLLSLYGQRFLGYGLIFKIAIFMIFGHETWPQAKVPEIAMHSLSTLTGSKIGLFVLYG